VVGWPSDIEAWTQQDLKDYFAIGYAPNNCTMVVVGDVTVARIMELAKKYGPKQFDNEMEKAGGNNNAWTSEDLTTYTDWFPSTALELMFDMEGDRIRDLSLDPKMVASERGVVYSERRTSVDNNNFGILYEQIHAAAFTAHPYHWPVLGWPSDIEAWTQQDLKDYFAIGYAPNNCTMIVVGDVTVARVMELAKKYI
jgi:zinc protease